MLETLREHRREKSSQVRWRWLIAGIPLACIVFFVAGMLVVRMMASPERTVEKPAVGEVGITIIPPPAGTSAPGPGEAEQNTAPAVDT